jgi:hypothetical protein
MWAGRGGRFSPTTANGGVSISLAGSTFDTTLAVYTGSSVGALTLVASNNDCPVPGSPTAAASPQSCVSFSTGATSTVYYIQVSGATRTQSRKPWVCDAAIKLAGMWVAQRGVAHTGTWPVRPCCEH